MKGFTRICQNVKGGMSKKGVWTSLPTMGVDFIASIKGGIWESGNFLNGVKKRSLLKERPDTFSTYFFLGHNLYFEIILLHMLEDKFLFVIFRFSS